MPNSLQWSSGQDLSLSVVRYSADKARVQFPVSELLFAAALRVLGWLWGGVPIGWFWLEFHNFPISSHPTVLGVAYILVLIWLRMIEIRLSTLFYQRGSDGLIFLCSLP
jgi:hypothetical protein